ncbi:MAG TPA: tetratricopeptide repeat protein, partial [Chromatiaceae bacterium]|nr:tetratricopeptide repeat protein [Chromatiaceae bacterium]
FITEAQIYKELGKPEQALRLYGDAIIANPKNPDLLYAGGLLAADMGDIEQAEKDFKAVLKLSPDDADALNALGYTLADQTDRLEEAFGYIQRAYEQMPDSAAILDSMGWLLYRMGKLKEALGYLEKAAAKLQDGEIAAHLGEVLWMLGRKEQAREVWEKAREHAPDNPKLKQTIQRFL